MKACINVISSRAVCLKPCLESVWEKYNHKYNYPVYVYYFDDIYDSEDLQKQIIGDTGQNVIFRSIPYETPKHIDEKEMFYNRKDVWYAATQFPISRKGYLHMCHFMCNFHGYPNTDYHLYDYSLHIDDESQFTEDVPYDFFERMEQMPEVDMAAMKVYDQNIKKPHQGNFDTRINLWNFIKVYLKHYGITPKSKFMQDLMNDPNADENFHFYPCADSYIIRLSMFESPEWKQWINAVNKYGGIYKYRWGDNDVNSLFYLIHYADDIYDFKTVDEGYHAQGALRHLQDYAPGVKDNSR